MTRENLVSLLTIDTQEKVWSLVKRTKPRDMMGLIREICAQNIFTVSELAVILNRKNTKDLYNRYIFPLLREHKIEKTNPEKPNHPKPKIPDNSFREQIRFQFKKRAKRLFGLFGFRVDGNHVSLNFFSGVFINV